MITAKKDYLCSFCSGDIKKGTKYKRVNMKSKPVLHICPKCKDIDIKFNRYGYLMSEEEILDDYAMEDAYDGQY